MEFHSEIAVSQNTAGLMLMQIPETWSSETDGPWNGRVEADET